MAIQDLATARSHALFLCELQPSQHPAPEQVHAAIRRTVLAYGVRGCLARVAQEYGDHPETAAPRMRWARELVSQTYPDQTSAPSASRPRGTAAPRPRVASVLEG